MANSVYKNVYLFHGQENFLREAAVKAAVNGVPLNIPELNYMVLDEKTPANDIIVACETLPVMDESRVILVKDSPCFSGSFSNIAFALSATLRHTVTQRPQSPPPYLLVIPALTN